MLQSERRTTHVVNFKIVNAWKLMKSSRILKMKLQLWPNSLRVAFIQCFSLLFFCWPSQVHCLWVGNLWTQQRTASKWERNRENREMAKDTFQRNTYCTFIKIENGECTLHTLCGRQFSEIIKARKQSLDGSVQNTVETVSYTVQCACALSLQN